MKKTTLFFLLFACAFSMAAQEGFIGEIRLFAGTFAPRNWAFCDGKTLTVSQNRALFNVISNAYGGDGYSTFALPNLGGIPLDDLEYQDASSESGGQQISFTAQNSTDASIDMHWVDYTGASKFYASIPPGATITQTSATGHVWLFKQGDALLEAIKLNGQQYNQQFTIKPRVFPRYIICLNGAVPARY